LEYVEEKKQNKARAHFNYAATLFVRTYWHNKKWNKRIYVCMYVCPLIFCRYASTRTR